MEDKWSLQKVGFAILLMTAVTAGFEARGEGGNFSGTWVGKDSFQGCGQGAYFKFEMNGYFFKLTRLSRLSLDRNINPAVEYEGVVKGGSLDGQAFIDNTGWTNGRRDKSPITGIVSDDGRKLIVTYDVIFPRNVSGSRVENWHRYKTKCTYVRID